MTRRQWLIGAGVGAAAAAAAAGKRAKGLPVGGPAPPPGLLGLRVGRAGGGELSPASLRGKPLVLNFWATWCPPCISELPLLDRFHREQNPRGWTVVALAVDSPTPVREFLRQRPLSMPVGLAGLEGVEFGRALGNAQGGLPFTVVLGSDGSVAARKLGALKEQDISAWPSIR